MTPGVEIRAAGAGDLVQVAALANRFNASVGFAADAYDATVLTQESQGRDAFLTILIAVAEGTVVGYAVSHPWWNPFAARMACWLADFYVEEDWRSRGIGRRLISAVAAQALDRGWHSLWWGVDFDNERGRAFYHRLQARSAHDEILALDETALRALAASGDTS